MIPLWANCLGLNAGLSFWLPLDDLGGGAVSLVPNMAAGSPTPTFTRATTATTILSSGLIGSVASNTARSCYSPAGVYLGYLAEEARTNLCLQSADLTTTWTLGAATIGGSVTLPDGTTGTKNKIQEDNTTNSHNARQSFTKAASALAYTFSVYVQQAERTWCEIVFWDGTNGNRFWFNLATGVVGSSAAIGTGFTSTSFSIQAAGSGFFRCVVMATSTTATTLQTWIGASTGDTVDSYLGTTGSGIFAWGAQLEQATFATSYIPTTTVAVARNADVLTYPTSGNVLGATGTCYAESTWANTTAVSGPDILDTFPSAIQMNIGGGGSPVIGLYDGSSRAPGPTLTVTATTVQKVATKWDGGANSSNGCGNGTLGTPTAWTTPTLGATMYLGNRQGGGANVLGGTIKNLRIWTRALADSQLVSLTS